MFVFRSVFILLFLVGLQSDAYAINMCEWIKKCIGMIGGACSKPSKAEIAVASIVGEYREKYERELSEVEAKTFVEFVNEINQGTIERMSK